MATQLMPDPESDPAPAPGLARSAGLLSAGNIAGRILGLLREMVIAHHFGASGAVSAFRIAVQTPTLLYDFLVGGMLSAALVPVLSDLARHDRAGFVRLAHLLVSLFTVGLAGLTLLLALAAPALSNLLAGGFRAEHPELLALTTSLIRATAPVVWLLGLAGVLTAILFAQQRFTFPALATAVYNLGIVVATPLLAPTLGVTVLTWGLLAGGVAQVALLAWDVRRSGLTFRLHGPVRHPALRKIVRLYAPIAAGMVVALFQVALDRRLASGAGEQSIAWMANATTLQQMPLGLISVAVALAALPRLSQFAAARDEVSYHTTLDQGLRMVTLLIAPAAVGLWLLGEPLTRLLFERGAFTPDDTLAVTRALSIYVVGMLFAAVDFPLNYAFYARNDTLTPALVGVLSVGVYVVVALALVGRMGYLGLVWADTAKQASHAVIMYLLLSFRRQGGGRLHEGLAAIGVASAFMAGGVLLVRWLAATPTGGGWGGDLALVATAAGVGILLYGFVLHSLGVAEARLVWAAARQRMGRRRN